MSDKEPAALMGKCQACRYSQQRAVPGAVGVHLFCLESGKPEYTRPHWQCGRFEYEPGSLG